MSEILKPVLERGSQKQKKLKSSYAIAATKESTILLPPVRQLLQSPILDNTQSSLPQIETEIVEEDLSSARSKPNNGTLQRRGSNKGAVTRFPVISPMSNGNIN